MKILTWIVLLLLVASTAFADVYVQPYYRKDGTYVSGHYRSSPNSNPYDNWSSKGNVNPYTGKKGYNNPSALDGGYQNSPSSGLGIPGGGGLLY